ARAACSGKGKRNTVDTGEADGDGAAAVGGRFRISCGTRGWLRRDVRFDHRGFPYWTARCRTAIARVDPFSRGVGLIRTSISRFRIRDPPLKESESCQREMILLNPPGFK